MKDNLAASLAYIFNDEGGFAERPEEPGGACNMGVSLVALDRWRKSQGRGRPGVDDVRALTKEEATDIYTAHYAAPIRFDELPPGLDYIMLNTAVMQGVTGSIQLLQAALGMATPLGRYDDTTWEAIKASDVGEVGRELLILQLAKKLTAPSASKFGNGWANRLLRVLERAKPLLPK
jgi:lysozyme family protein